MNDRKTLTRRRKSESEFLKRLLAWWAKTLFSQKRQSSIEKQRPPFLTVATGVDGIVGEVLQEWAMVQQC
ncbi:MAG: hypothetical protein N2117_13705 [Anaerolineales bacterium]|nr:hypothetical protein [Anaerolineales bacterium]MCX7756280.1 hypothetical protein [Anaerolineales bacterium]MDW8276638.1 hypothetical protein [Anaerolineales bacterium]